MSSANDDRPAAESVRVNIFGRTYSLRSTQGGDRVRGVAAVVDGRMREIASHLSVHDAAKVAVLAALNLADELQLVREHYEREIESLLTRGPGEVEEIPVPYDGADERPSASSGDGPTAGGAHGEAAEGGGLDAADRGAGVGDARRSWFDEIFDTEFSQGGGPGRLSSQVSTRLQRLRQATREGTISDGETADE